MAANAQRRLIADYLQSRGFDVPDGPTIPPLDVAERDTAALALAVTLAAVELGIPEAHLQTLSPGNLFVRARHRAGQAT